MFAHQTRSASVRHRNRAARPGAAPGRCPDHPFHLQSANAGIDSIDPDRLAYLLAATIQGGYVLAIAAQDPSHFEDARAGALDLLRASAPATSSVATAAATQERN